MAIKQEARQDCDNHGESGITGISVTGFKSIRLKQSIEFRALTILAGANCSGKSSIMQPLLLLKQTVEAPHDPGSLLLNGPNVRFTNSEQLLSRDPRVLSARGFSVSIGFGGNHRITTYFRRDPASVFEVSRVEMVTCDGTLRFRQKMSSNEVFGDSR